VSRGKGPSGNEEVGLKREYLSHMEGPWAHIRGLGRDNVPHDLAEHLLETSRRASSFAEEFGAGEWGRLAGLWHDLGKYQQAFQDKLHGEQRTVEHSIVGALLAADKGLVAALPLVFAIAGHHGGLPNLEADQIHGSPLQTRLRTHGELLSAVRSAIPSELASIKLPVLPPALRAADINATRRRLEFFTRMLFSCLVDADFLDTEEFFQPGRRAVQVFDAIGALRRRLDAAIATVAARAADSPINAARREILAACRSAVANPQGMFSLTVPTGGGKTLSAMAFAIAHAELHLLTRVICVIPYTSIIEQNAAVYREALGMDNVVEHHSNLDPNEESSRSALASENWDAPVIVTTTVQFFESLLANRTSRCRKLHNIVRSVIVLDEVQSLPVELLAPILDVLQELVARYGCSVVLATATPPALRRRDALPIGIENIREIVPNPSALAQRLRRVRIAWPKHDSPPIDWPHLADQVARHEQVLAVVHRRADARELACLLPAEGTYHLSALMCPRHRLDVIARVHQALESGQTCRLVSTQLIEAGVDLDFPVVFRALAGLDSVVQAAGRCNREGHSRLGTVHVFLAPSAPPQGTLRIAFETARGMLIDRADDLDPTDPAVMEDYFRRLYHKLEPDRRGIQAQRAELNFANTADLFHMIEDGYSTPVVVPYGEAAERIAAARSAPSRKTFRALQPFTVSVHPQDITRLQEAGALDPLNDPADSALVLTEPFSHLYDERFGLCVLEKPTSRPEANIV